MTIGDRIRLKREELGLTQTDLANKMGYSGKASVSKAEHWGNEITTTKVKKFADALGVTFEFLMGWEQAPLELNEAAANEQVNIYNLFARLDPNNKEKVIEYVEMLLAKQHSMSEDDG